MSKRLFCGLFAAVLLVGLGLRLARLDARPMHHDEANQAVRFGGLLESGEYRYDRNDHHGPTLYYLTLPSAWLRGQHTLAALDERTLRVVPALFGAGTILLFLLLARPLGRTATLASAALLAISPAFTYYSRFYIQESLFVFFAAGFVIALGRYAASTGRFGPSAAPQRFSTPSLPPQARLGWALAAGIFAGLAYATKETSLIVLAAAGVACAVTLFVSSVHDSALGSHEGNFSDRALLHLGVAILAAVAVAFLFYSSFFTNPAGIVESVRAFAVYARRGVEAGGHSEPWSYYLRLLAWSSSGGLVWSEGLVLVLALAGVGAALRRRESWPTYICLYSLLTAAAFSLLRYKTPWNLLPFHAGFVLMAGVGVGRLFQTEPGPLPLAAVPGKARASSRGLHGVRAAIFVVLVVALGQLAFQAWRTDVRYGADPRNPYAYVHTSPDFLRLVKRIDDLAAVHPDRRNMLVKVVAGPYEQWPLPWYLRGMKRVGYWPTAREAAPLDAAPVVVASQDNTSALDAALGDRYVPEFYGLRPGVLLTVYIERSLWERFLSRERGHAADSGGRPARGSWRQALCLPGQRGEGAPARGAPSTRDDLIRRLSHRRLADGHLLDQVRRTVHLGHVPQHVAAVDVD